MGITTNRLVAALGAAVAAAVAPALLFASAGNAHADECDGSLAFSYYCSPAAGISPQTPQEPAYTPVQPAFGYNNLPQCSGGPLAAINGALSGEGC
jgi:hypothetical protein